MQKLVTDTGRMPSLQCGILSLIRQQMPPKGALPGDSHLVVVVMVVSIRMVMLAELVMFVSQGRSIYRR